jgi:hypothetical protein
MLSRNHYMTALIERRSLRRSEIRRGENRGPGRLRVQLPEREDSNDNHDS